MARPKTLTSDTKPMYLKIPKDLFMYVKKSALIAECNMATIVINALESQRKKVLEGFTDKEY